VKTYTPKKNEVGQTWWVVDAEGETLGRLASRIATILRGKHKPAFTPHMDLGDYVIVINSAKVAVTGRRLDQKIYYRHSGYPGGLSETRLKDMLVKHPERVIELAVRGMLPRNRLSRVVLSKLKVYAGPTHPHGNHKPQILALGPSVALAPTTRVPQNLPDVETAGA
jgi:large subunit ribosomal protein L13